MGKTELILYAAQLSFGALASFFAILLWSKTHDGAVMCLVAGTVIAYAGVIYRMLEDMGVVSALAVRAAGVPLVPLFFAVVPPVLFAIAFIMMIWRSRR